MGQQQGIVEGSALLSRMVLVLSVAAIMAALMLTSVTPAFAASNTTFTCFGTTQGAEGLSKGQAKQFETNNPGAFCVPADQRQLEVLAGQQKQLVKEVPPGQQRKLAEESLAEEPIGGVRQIVEEPIAGVRQIVEEQSAEVFPTEQRQRADGLI